MKKMLFIILIVFLTLKVTAQPFADILNFSYQTFSTQYKYKLYPSIENKTDDYFLNLFLPKEFKNGNTFLLRINNELISTQISTSAYIEQLGSVSTPVGMQFVSKNKKWKTVTMVVPKVASNFKDEIEEHDYQIGGIFLENYVHSDKLKIKAGLYYNYEAFGNFFVPLVGIDWKATSRINLYGILPTNYKAEYMIVKNKLYTGLGFKSLTRSFRLSKVEGYDYVRYDEMQLKLFLDAFVYKKILLFGEVGYTLGKSPLLYFNGTKDENIYSTIYRRTEEYILFNVGIAYRIRMDLDKADSK